MGRAFGKGYGGRPNLTLLPVLRMSRAFGEDYGGYAFGNRCSAMTNWDVLERVVHSLQPFVSTFAPIFS